MIKKFFLSLVIPNNFCYIAVRQLSTNTMQPIPNITRFDRLIRILGQNRGPMTLQGTNSYLIGTAEKRLLLDTTDPNKKDYVALVEQVLKQERAVISDVVITHWHHDHIGAVENLREKNLIDENCNVWKFPRSDIKEDFDEMKIKQLTDGHEFRVDEDTTLKVHFTPGHTTDHVILYDERERTVFSGDCILGEGTAVFEDLYDYMNSLEKILDLKPDKIYPGHGNLITDAVERIKFYISHRQERERQILEVLTAHSPLSCMGIVSIVYQDVPEKMWTAAAYNVQHHLTKLKKEGRVNQIDRDSEIYFEIASHSNKL
ncbi:unnamed protein product [Chironomus riparius]|uniref:Beta-lactamase-like protein 2 homolog n=1 Tax=Chironomus riparius TaxID=315576 RepID=A0A9N9RVX7_9DIPT|nr:unnamed protein product [Chironomus riparius]